MTCTAIDSSGNVGNTSFLVTVNANLNTMSLTIDTGLVGFQLSSNAIITLDTPATFGGTLVTLSSSLPAILEVEPPGTVLIPEGETVIGQIQVNGIDTGMSTLLATAPNFADATLEVTVTKNLISIPTTLNMAPQQSVSNANYNSKRS